MPGLERFIGEVLDGKYRLEKLLGQGGMGAVYLATHLGTDRAVALKLIAPQFMRNEEFVERFQREARAAGRLRHPNVVDVTDFGFADSHGERVAYLVMEYLDGCTLADVLAEEKRLPLDWVVELLDQVASAVEEAHRQGIVHRDLKPDNIWLEPTRIGGYRVKVLDFGIAKLGEAGFDEETETPRPEVDPLPAASAQPAQSSLEALQASIARAAASLRTGGDENGADASRDEAATQLYAPGNTGTGAARDAGSDAGNDADNYARPSQADNVEAATQVFAPQEQRAGNVAAEDEQGTRIFAPPNADNQRAGGESAGDPKDAGRGAAAETLIVAQGQTPTAARTETSDEDSGDAAAHTPADAGASGDSRRTVNESAASSSSAPSSSSSPSSSLPSPDEAAGARATARVEAAPRETQFADDADRTRLLDAAPAAGSGATPRQLDAPGTRADAGALTRVGSIMGTPLYMSPEQCRGERLDARSDIYSLGVIAYQMLAGETPFAGDMVTVMRRHVSDRPPPLREKNPKVRKRVERVVLSALAKDRAARPQSATAFASSLRANSAGTGTLMRRAFALYSEHFPTFLRLTLFAHIPVFITTALLFAFQVAGARGAVETTTVIAAAILIGLLHTVANFITSSVISGVTAVIVTQLQLAPLRPVSLRAAFAVLRLRWRPFLRTSVGVTMRIFLGICLCIIPGLWMMVKYTLYAPVVLIEGVARKAALQRADELSRRSRLSVIALLAINLTLPIIIGWALGGFSAGADVPGEGRPAATSPSGDNQSGDNRGGVNVSTKTGQSGVSVTKSEDGGAGGKRKKEMSLKREAGSHLISLLNIFLVPLVSITTALLYLRLRLMGGETMRDALAQFEEFEPPRTRWQQRMRDRLTARTTSGHRRVTHNTGGTAGGSTGGSTQG